ncbi:MAG: hypothetical protein KGK03_10780 [Candidatus Omnitrophica bacterium]|nr:hypothetical protein [Candidatus Omnitrophota bacterium]MDE2223540.1 hypothetical protein [Candidatus Omnitrophota bacterium]
MRIAASLFLGLILMAAAGRTALAVEHTQKDGLFSLDVPAEWHWVEYPQDIIITYPDGQTMAIDIEISPSGKLSPAQMKKALKEANDKMISEGVLAHHGTVIDNKEIKVDGVYATRLDFKTAPPQNVTVAYIAFFNKGYAFTITYGSTKPKTLMLLDDVAASFKFR